MLKTIKIVSERITNETKKMEKFLRERERKIQSELSISTPLFSAIFFVPILNDKSLGEFHEDGKIILLSENLLDEEESIVKNILLHELSHALEFALYGYLSGHQENFKEAAKLLNLPPEYAKATISSLERSEKNKKKVEKLLALSSSNFENERNEALKKAKELIIKNNITIKEKNNTNEEIYYVELYKSQRVPSYIKKLISLISHVTGTYFVITRDNENKVPTLYGSFESIELSLYLYDYLLSSFDNEIKAKKQELGISINKQSFIYSALSSIYKNITKEEDVKTKTALTVLHNENEKKAKSLVFKDTRLKLENTKTYLSDYKSAKLGLDFGLSIRLPKGINQRNIE